MNLAPSAIIALGSFLTLANTQVLAQQHAESMLADSRIPAGPSNDGLSTIVLSEALARFKSQREASAKAGGGSFYLFYDLDRSRTEPVYWKAVAFRSDGKNARSEQVLHERQNGVEGTQRKIVKYDCESGFGYIENSSPSSGGVRQFDRRTQGEDNVQKVCPEIASGYLSWPFMRVPVDDLIARDAKSHQLVGARVASLNPFLGIFTYEWTDPKEGWQKNGCSRDARALDKYGNYEDYAVKNQRCRTFVTFNPFRFYTLIFESGASRPRYIAVSGLFEDFSTELTQRDISFTEFPDRLLFAPVQYVLDEWGPGTTFVARYYNDLQLTDQQLADIQRRDREAAAESHARREAARQQEQQAQSDSIARGLASAMGIVAQQQQLQAQQEQARLAATERLRAQEAQLQAQRDQTAAFERQAAADRTAADQRALNERRQAALQLQQTQPTFTPPTVSTTVSQLPAIPAYTPPSASHAPISGGQPPYQVAPTSRLAPAFRHRIERTQKGYAIYVTNQSNFMIQCQVRIEGYRWFNGQQQPFSDTRALVISAGQESNESWDGLSPDGAHYNVSGCRGL